MDRALAGIPGTFPCADDVKVQGSTEELTTSTCWKLWRELPMKGWNSTSTSAESKKSKLNTSKESSARMALDPVPEKSMPSPRLQHLQTRPSCQVSWAPSTSWLSSFRIWWRRLNSCIACSSTTLTLSGPATCKRSSTLSRRPLPTQSSWSIMILRNQSSSRRMHPWKVSEPCSSKIRRLYASSAKPSLQLKSTTQTSNANFSPICLHVRSCTITRLDGRSSSIPTTSPWFKSSRSPSAWPLHVCKECFFVYPSLSTTYIDINIKYVGSKSVLLADTLSHLIDADDGQPIAAMDVNIAQVIKVEETLLNSLQEETKADATLSQWKERKLIVRGLPDSMQYIPVCLHPFWCFREELTMLDGLIMKGNRIVVPVSMRPTTLQRLHDAHQGLTSTLQRARRTVYWPKIQDDIKDMVRKCDECQIFGSKKAKSPQHQITAVRPMEVIGMDIMDFQGSHSLVIVDYFSGAIFFDHLNREKTDAALKILNSTFRKFGFTETIISNNGPCFRSEKFSDFCHQLDIRHVTSSPHYHQSNGRSERAIATIKQIMRKSESEVNITKGITAYLDTPISHSLPSSAELFLNQRINTRLSIVMSPGTLNEQQKQDILSKHSAHLDYPRRKETYEADQPIWLTEDGSPEWKPGRVDEKDSPPNSYWIISQNNGRRVCRSPHDMKSRYPRSASTSPARLSSLRPSPAEISAEGEISAAPTATSLVAVNRCGAGEATPEAAAEARTSTRQPKLRRDPDFVYS